MNELKDFIELRKRYSPILDLVIDETIKNLSKTRKGNRIAGRIITRELMYWDKFPISKVIGGCIVYNQKKLYEKGLPEKYLRGIIRNMNEYELKKLRLFTEEELKQRIEILYAELVIKCDRCSDGFVYTQKEDSKMIVHECECLKSFNKRRDEMTLMNYQWLNKLGEI
jgi:hypothetical protein